jgi:hypothetical protein
LISSTPALKIGKYRREQLTTAKKQSIMGEQELNELKLKLIKAICELEDEAILLKIKNILIGAEQELDETTNK